MSQSSILCIRTEFILCVFVGEVTILFQTCVKICDGFEIKRIRWEVVHLVAGAYNIKNNFASEIVDSK
jgi:hypothetical protein